MANAACLLNELREALNRYDNGALAFLRKKRKKNECIVYSYSRIHVPAIFYNKKL